MDKAFRFDSDLYLLDTCSFIDYANDCNDSFDFSVLKKAVEKGDARIVITVYSLFELIQEAFTWGVIEKKNKQFASVGDFWVQNVNHILEPGDPEYGLDFLDSLKMTRGDLILEFHNERERIREKINETLIKKIVFYIQALASLYLLLNDCRNKRTKASTRGIIEKIDSNFMGVFRQQTNVFFKTLYNHKGMELFTPEGRCRDFKGRKKIAENMQFFFLEAMAIAKTEYTLEEESSVSSAFLYCDMVTKNYKSFSDAFERNGYKETLQKGIKDSKDENVFDFLYYPLVRELKSTILSECYKKVLKKPFVDGCIPKSISNDLIDIGNIGIFERYCIDNPNKSVYVTSDSKWVEFIKESQKLHEFDSTNDFYKKYYRKWC